MVEFINLIMSLWAYKWTAQPASCARVDTRESESNTTWLMMIGAHYEGVPTSGSQLLDKILDCLTDGQQSSTAAAGSILETWYCAVLCSWDKRVNSKSLAIKFTVKYEVGILHGRTGCHCHLNMAATNMAAAMSRSLARAPVSSCSAESLHSRTRDSRSMARASSAAAALRCIATLVLLWSQLWLDWFGACLGEHLTESLLYLARFLWCCPNSKMTWI